MKTDAIEPRAKKPPGVKAKAGGTPLKRGAALQVMTYPRPITKGVIVEAAEKAGMSVSSFMIRTALDKAAEIYNRTHRRKRNVADFVPEAELKQYA